MKEFAVDRVRNAVLVGHGGVGKTSLAEGLLFSMGEVNRLGKVDEGSTISDYHPDEIERKISISSSLLHGEWKEFKVNVIDTPGYSDFLGDTKGSMRVADLAVVLVNAVEGLEVGTEQVIEFADEYSVSRLVFVNRMDNEHADFDKVLVSLQERFGNGVAPVQVPVNSGEGFSKVIDLIRMKLVTFESGDSGKFALGDIPAEWKDKAAKLRERMVETAAESDDKLLEIFLESGTLEENQILDGLRKGIAKRSVIPVLCGSASRNYGTQLLLDFIIEFGPSPLEPKKITGVNPETSQPVEREIKEQGPFCALVFKTVSEAHVGELSLIKVYSGVLSAGVEALNPGQKSTEKIGQIYLLNGKNRKEVGNLRAGDVAALVKLKHTSTGDTLCDKKSPILLSPIKFPEPVISVAVQPRSRGDEEKISNGLHMLQAEDPSFKAYVDSELHQTIISGQGELHLAVVIKRLKERYGVEVNEEKPKVPYRETITVKADDKYRHKKQSGGAGQFAEVWMKIEPLTRGEGFAFDNEVTGGAISGPFIPSVEKGVRSVLDSGPLAGYKVVDVKAIVYDGKEHPVDSKDIAFQIAGREVFKLCVLKARPILLEPIYDLEVKIPEDSMGDVMGDLSSRRGKIMGMDSKGRFQIIKAKIPLAELDRYATTLRSLTSGRGIHSRTFSHYDPVPKELENRIIQESKKEKEEEK